MSDKYYAFFISEESVRRYLINHGKGSDTKDSELAISVWVKRIIENAESTQFCIAFELVEDLKKTMPSFKGSDGDIKYVLEKLRKEYTPVDFALVKGNPEKHENTGWGFQLKRFGKGITANFNELLIAKINKLCAEHRPGQTGLIIIPEIDDVDEPELSELLKKGVQAKTVNQMLKVDKDSFKRVYLLTKSEKEVFLTQIYPGVRQFKTSLGERKRE